jgi:energy-coupling factor transport system permease protein
MLPILLFIAIINPFSTMPEALLSFISTGNLLLWKPALWFFCRNTYFRNDSFISRNGSLYQSHKFIFLFGKILPTIAMMITMTLRFIPTMKKRLNRISQTQSPLGISTSKGSLGKSFPPEQVFCLFWFPYH